MMETPVPDSVSAVHNATNPTRDLESEFDVGQESKIREIVMDNIDSEPKVCQITKCVHFWIADIEIRTLFLCTVLSYYSFA